MSKFSVRIVLLLAVVFLLALIGGWIQISWTRSF